jgi:hypothetical protein
VNKQFFVPTGEVSKKELTSESEAALYLLEPLYLLEFVNALHLHLQSYVLSVLPSSQMARNATNTRLTMIIDATFITAYFFANSKQSLFIALCVESVISTTSSCTTPM